MTATPFTCPRCGSVSHNPHDAEHRYCARCHVFVDEPTISTKWSRYESGKTVLEYDAIVAVAQGRKLVRSQYLRNGDLFCHLPPLPTKPESDTDTQPERTDDDSHQ